jgi:uncharacterized protein (TIGR03437 family)
MVNFSGDNGPATNAQLNGPMGVALDSAGNVYVADTFNNRIRKVSNGVITTVAGNGTPGFSGDTGSATSAELYSPGAVALDSAGNLYIADSGNNRIRKVSNGVITTVAGNGTPGLYGDNGPATGAELDGPTGVAVDSAGNLYISDFYNCRIRKVSNGVITTVAGSGPGSPGGFSGDNGLATNAQLSAPAAVAVDSAGNIYIADFGNNRIRKVSNGVITTVAGNGATGFSGDNGPAINAQFNGTEAVALDSAGSLYIADTQNNRIRKVSNGVITTVAGNGTSGFGGDNGPAISAQLALPQGVALDPAGNLYIADSINWRIRKVSNAVITTVAGSGISGFTGTSLGDNGPATSAALDGPRVVAVDTAGNLYIADTDNSRIRKVSNGVITTVAGNGTLGFSGDNAPATSAQLNHPTGVAVDAPGNVYIVDSFNSRIRKVSNGVITTLAGNGTSGFSGDNGPAATNALNYPTGVAIDIAGNLYIADTNNNRIRKVSNGVITTVAGTGTSGFSGDNGPATNAKLAAPSGVAIDSAGNLYIADVGNNRIRKIWNGMITTVAGNGFAGSGCDGGQATKSALNHPTGVASDSAGNLYIADYEDNRICRVSNGVITTVAGNGKSDFSGDNGPATSAKLAGPYGVGIDPAGNVYVADSGNSRIRILTLTGFSCTYSVTPISLEAPSAGGNLTVSIQTAASCPWTISGLPSWITVSSATSANISATICFAIAPNPGAARTATIAIANAPVQVTQQSGISVPSISPGGVVNAASSAVGSPVAPGSIATAYGSFLISSPATSSGAPLPNGLAGLSMHFGSGIEVPLFAVSGAQVNLQVPWELAGQSQASLSATVNSQTGAAQTVKLAAFAPGIFSMNSQGTGQGAVLDTSYRLVDSSNPATAGSTVIQIYCTGLGAVTNQPASGSAALSDPLSSTTTMPTVMIGGAQASVLFSGLAPGSVGEYQVNVLVPGASAKGSAVQVVLAIGGTTSNTVTMAVQ